MEKDLKTKVGPKPKQNIRGSMSKGKKAKPFQKLQLQQFRFQHLA